MRARYTAVYDVLIYRWRGENTDIFTGQFHYMASNTANHDCYGSL